MKSDEKFRELLLNLFEKPQNTDVGDEQFEILNIFNQLSQLIGRQEVSPFVVVKSLYESAMKHPPQRRHQILTILRDFSRQLRENNKYSYPEFLWIINEMELCNESSTLQEIEFLTKTLIDVAGVNIARSYLNFLVIKYGQNILSKVASVYYYTSHNIESLQIISQSTPDTDVEVYRHTYRITMGQVFSQQEKLTDYERDNLYRFFKQGENSIDNTIKEASQKALSRLADM